MLIDFIRAHPALALLIAFAAAFMLLHIILYIHPSPIDSPAVLQARLNGGRPVLLEIYSNL